MTTTERRRQKRRKQIKTLLCAVGSIVVILLMASFVARGKPLKSGHDATDEALVSMVIATDAKSAPKKVDELATQPPLPSEEPPKEPEEAPVEIDEPAETELYEAEVEMLACAIYREAGGNMCSDKCRYMVGDVILNRVADDRFPDTIELVLTQKVQYGRFYWTGIVWPERASYPEEAAAVQRAYDTALALLSGEHSEIYGAGYVWQAEFEQGEDIIQIDGLYFGR